MLRLQLYTSYSRKANQGENKCEVGNSTNGKKSQIGQDVSMLAEVCQNCCCTKKYSRYCQQHHHAYADSANYSQSR